MDISRTSWPRGGGGVLWHIKNGGVLGAGHKPKKGGLRCGHNLKRGLRCGHNPKKGELGTGIVNGKGLRS